LTLAVAHGPLIVSVSAAAVPEVSEAPAIEVAFREARPSDEPVLNRAFLMGMRDNPYTNGLPNDAFFALARRIWGGIQREMETVVAHVPGQPSEIMGYVTYTKDDRGQICVAWLSVAKNWRRMRVGTRLLERVGVRPHVKFAVILAKPRALAWFRAVSFHPAFTPFATWKWLGVESAT